MQERNADLAAQSRMRALKSRGGLTASVRLSWVYTMHQCAAVHNAMTNFTGLHHKTSEQHAEMSHSRVKRDMTDQQKILTWFENHNPFNQPNSLPCNLTSGLTADDVDTVNCDEAERIGNAIQQQLNGQVFADIVIRKKDTVKSLTHLQKGICVEGQTITVNCNNLFNRIFCWQRDKLMCQCTSHKLAPVPAALFKDNMMRKPDKVALGRALMNDASVSDSQMVSTCVVLDGGALLHKVHWQKASTYQLTVHQYLITSDTALDHRQKITNIFVALPELLQLLQFPQMHSCIQIRQHSWPTVETRVLLCVFSWNV